MSGTMKTCGVCKQGYEGGGYALGASGCFRVSRYQSWNYVLVGMSEEK